jgi:hypothetical protein
MAQPLQLPLQNMNMSKLPAQGAIGRLLDVLTCGRWACMQSFWSTYLPCCLLFKFCTWPCCVLVTRHSQS